MNARNPKAARRLEAPLDFFSASVLGRSRAGVSAGKRGNRSPVKILIQIPDWIHCVCICKSANLSVQVYAVLQANKLSKGENLSQAFVRLVPQPIRASLTNAWGENHAWIAGTARAW